MTSYREAHIVHDMVGEIVLDYDKDVTYVVKREEKLHLQIIFPINQPQKQKKYPCIVYMMSTNEVKEDIYHYIPRLTQFAQRGFVVALMEKPSANSTYEEQINLTGNAVHYLSDHAAEYNIASDNIFIWRDGTHKDHIKTPFSNHDILEDQEYHEKIKAVVCFGEKEQVQTICSKLKLKIPPVLMIPCEDNKTSNLDFWTEEVFDVIEDYVTNYIV